MPEYRLSPAAERDLESIWRFTQTKWTTQQADRYVDSLVNACSTLAYAPLIGVACDHVRSGYRRYWVERHVIYFRVTDYGIAVIRILHDRMESQRHL